MGYAAIALAILGFAIGVMFQLRVLLMIVGLLLLLSIVFSIGHGFTFLGTLLTIMVAQTVLQGAYFIGLIARSIFYRTDRGRPPISRPPQDLPSDRRDFRFLTF